MNLRGKKMRRIFWIVLLAGSLATELPAGRLTQQDYLAEVNLGNRAVAAAKAADAALGLAALEPRAMLSPMLDASVVYVDDQAEPTTPFSPSRATATTAEARISKQLNLIGTRLSVGFKESNNAIGFPSGSFISPDGAPFYSLTNGLTFGLSQPLLRDFGARGYQIQQRKANAASEGARLMNRYAAAGMLFEARAAYITLAGMRAVGLLLSESLERNQRILDWTRAKYSDNLVDKVDLLQVQAALKQVESGLNQTRAEEARAAEKFNVLRGLDPKSPVGELEFPEPPKALPEAVGERLDLQAAQKRVEGGDAAVDEVKERFMPDLSVFGSATTSGTDLPEKAGYPTNSIRSWDFDHPTYVVGVKLSSTLDLPLYKKVLEGAKLAAGQGRETLVEQKLKTESDWTALDGQWAALVEQIKLARALEEIQKDKAEREKKRYRDGRTTNFQVLRFEEDYNQARINSLRLKMQAGILAAQAEFYNGGKLKW